VFAGTHAYLEEYKCPSPQGVSTQIQRCLHGAWIREEISPDPDVAELYFQKAVEMARQDLEAQYAKRNKNVEEQRDERLAFLEIEKDQALVEIQNRLARFYSRIGRDEQAATVWTRLWKLSEKEYSRPASSSSGSFGFGSLFGGASADRPLISQKDAIPFAKSAADCWMRMGEYEMAEEALAWTLSTLASTTTSTSQSTISRIEEIGLLSTLGALYVRQAKFEYALSLFVKALQAVQDHRAQYENSIEATAGGNVNEKAAAALKEDRDMWYCREAILTQSIGETLYGAATRSSSSSTDTIITTAETEPKKSSSWKFWSSSPSSPTPAKPLKAESQKSPEQIKKEEEALGWMQKALAMAKDKSGEHRDCDECAALGLNNLGLINEVNNYVLCTMGIHFIHTLC
jgi:tetratricopeptide (TPR) repeat protein